MDDKQIIRLFFERSEQAITELSQKYGDLCMKIARSILNDHQDAEECVSWRMEQYSSSIPRPAESLYLPYRSQPLFEEASRKYRDKAGQPI